MDSHNKEWESIFEKTVINTIPFPYADMVVHGLKNLDSKDIAPFFLAVDTKECATFFTEAFVQFISTPNSTVSINLTWVYKTLFARLRNNNLRYKAPQMYSIFSSPTHNTAFFLKRTTKESKSTKVEFDTIDKLIGYVKPILQQFFIGIVADIKREIKKT